MKNRSDPSYSIGPIIFFVLIYFVFWILLPKPHVLLGPNRVYILILYISTLGKMSGTQGRRVILIRLTILSLQWVYIRTGHTD